MSFDCCCGYFLSVTNDWLERSFRDLFWRLALCCTECESVGHVTWHFYLCMMWLEGRTGRRLCDGNVRSLRPDTPGSKRDPRRVALRLLHRYLLAASEQEVEGSTSEASEAEGSHAQTARQLPRCYILLFYLSSLCSNEIYQSTYVCT